MFWRGNWILWVHNYVRAKLTTYKNLLNNNDTLTKMEVRIDQWGLPTFYWLPKLHKSPYKSRFISKSGHCSTTILYKHITSALIAVKYHVFKYSETTFSNSKIILAHNNSSEVIKTLWLRNFQSSQVYFIDFSPLYTSLPHDFIKIKDC